jgi:orotidine-5'-phosphate decarboxylase
MNKKTNKIVIAMDNDIDDGLRLLETVNEDPELKKKVYGVKIGSLWVLEKGVDIVKNVRDRVWGDCAIILDMQKWPTDIPDIVKKQVCRVADTEVVDELIACPMGGGKKSLEAFVNSCKDGGMRPLCVLEMTHPDSDAYLITSSYKYILYDAGGLGIDGFIIPATKDPKTEIKWHIETTFPKLLYDLYATGFKVQGGQAEPMRRFGVSRYIIGRAIYEAEDPIKAINYAYDEINGIPVG